MSNATIHTVQQIQVGLNYHVLSKLNKLEYLAEHHNCYILDGRGPKCRESAGKSRKSGKDEENQKN